MTDCIFCKIIQKQIPTDLIFEDEYIVHGSFFLLVPF